MTNDLRPDELGEHAMVEVLVYRDGALAHRERCESEEEAAEVVALWEEVPGTSCQVVSFAPHPHADADGEVEVLDADDTFPHGGPR